LKYGLIVTFHSPLSTGVKKQQEWAGIKYPYELEQGHQQYNSKD